LLADNKEIGLEEKADKTKYMVMSRDQNAGRRHNIKTDNSSFERVEHFKYLGTTLTNQNSTHIDIKSRLNSRNECYHSVQNLLFSSLLYKNIKIKIHRTVILPVVRHGCETWLLTSREERRLMVFENRMLRSIFRPKRDEVTGEWRKLHNEELNDLYSSLNIFRVIKSRSMRWAGDVARLWESRGVYRILMGHLRESDHLKDPSADGRIIFKIDLSEVGCGDSDWIDLAQDRDRRRALVHAIMNLRVQ